MDAAKNINLDPSMTPPGVSGGGSVQAGNTTTNSVGSSATVYKPKKKGFKTVFIVFLFLLLLLGGGYLLYNYLTGGGGLIFRNEIVWWGLWEDEDVIKPLIDDYKKLNPKVNIKYVQQSKEDYRERLTNALAKGDGPDIFTFHNSWTPMFKSELSPVPETVYSAAEFNQLFYPVMVSDLSTGTSTVGIPIEYDGLALYVNEEIFEKAGKQYPATWNDLRQTAKDLTVKDERGSITQAGVALGRTENVDHWPEILGLMMLQNGANLNNPTGSLAEGALKYYTLFSQSDKVWDETLPTSSVFFAQGKLAMYFGPSWRAFEIRAQNPNLKFKTIPLPQLPKTELNEPDVAYASYWAEGVWNRSDKVEDAWNFLKYLTSTDTLEKFYNNASKVRMFGEPYPRTDMQQSLLSHPILGSLIKDAVYAQSWYLQSRTFDGPTGINSQITKYFEDAINAVNDRERVDEALVTVSSGVSQVLSQYGIKPR